MNGDEPLILESGLYSREQVLRKLQVSKATLAEWQKDGLQVCRKNTKRVFYLGRDVIEFLRRPESN